MRSAPKSLGLKPVQDPLDAHSALDRKAKDLVTISLGPEANSETVASTGPER